MFLNEQKCLKFNCNIKFDAHLNFYYFFVRCSFKHIEVFIKCINVVFYCFTFYRVLYLDFHIFKIVFHPFYSSSVLFVNLFAEIFNIKI